MADTPMMDLNWARNNMTIESENDFVWFPSSSTFACSHLYRGHFLEVPSMSNFSTKNFGSPQCSTQAVDNVINYS